MINARAKGARYEREIAALLRAFGYEAMRGCQFAGGQDSPDVKCDDFPCHIEAKFVERLNIWAAYRQAERDSGKRMPCVIHRKKLSPFSLITLKLEDFIQLTNNNKDEQ